MSETALRGTGPAQVMANDPFHGHVPEATAVTVLALKFRVKGFD